MKGVPNVLIAFIVVLTMVNSCFCDSTMNLVLFDTKDYPHAICNDGTPAGFYWRPGSGSGANRFVIHLQGGAWCYDEGSCAYRWSASPDLMSSKPWSATRNYNSGLFSTSEDNNVWYNSNAVYMMYCSSDVWTGNGVSNYANSTTQWKFYGKQIVAAAIDLLWKDYKLNSATEILFSGCSAGGQGVVLNLDFVSELLSEKKSKAVIKGFADAGWLQNFVPYYSSSVSTSTQMFSGFPMWNGMLPKNCMLANPGWEWLCYFSPFAYPHIRTPIFIQTEQFDTYQVTSNCAYPPYNDDQWEYVQSVRYAFDSSLQMIKNKNSYYSAACFHHCSSENSSYNTIKINGYSLSQVLPNWYFETGSPTWEFDTCKGFNCSVGCPTSAY